MKPERKDDDGILLVAIRVGTTDEDPAVALRALLSVARNVKGAVVESLEPPLLAGHYDQLRAAGFHPRNIEHDLGLVVTAHAEYALPVQPVPDSEERDG